MYSITVIFVFRVNNSGSLQADLEEGEIVEDLAQSQEILIYNKLSKILTNIQKLFPELISLKRIERARSFYEDSVYPTINLEFSTKDSWLEMPTPEFTSDSVGIWPTSTVFPSSTRNIVPSKAQNEMPAKLPYKFVDNNLEKFFEAEPLGHNKKVKLDSRIFENPEIPLPSEFNHVNQIDRIVRKSLVENLLVDQFVVSSNTHICNLLEDWDHFSQRPDELKQHLITHSNMLQVALAANLRSRNFSIALFTMNKINFRDGILKLFSGNSSSFNSLRGSCLTSPTLFGDLPENFVNKLEQTYYSKTYMLRPVSAKGKSYPQKRNLYQYGHNSNTGGSNSYNSTKVFKPDMNVFSTNTNSNPSRFSGNTSNSKNSGHSPKNTNTNNQFFPSSKGKGRSRFQNNGKK